MKMQNNNKLTVIVPRLPPSIDGLGDYGLSLAKQLRQEFGVQTTFIVGDPNWKGSSVTDGFVIHTLSTRTAQALESLLPANANDGQTVVVHYVGYGYAKRGSPLWLIRGLSKWRKKAPERNLITMFHELFAFGPVWTSQFWTSPFQRYLAAQLGLLSDHALTSQDSYAKIMSKLSKGKHRAMAVLPVFSNIGEPKYILPLLQRDKCIVVFGSRGPRTRLYKNSLPELLKLCQKFGITEIIDIGPPLEFSINRINNISVRCYGVLEAEKISAILARSMIGLINYPTAYLAKSGIFAAYCAHGLLPVVAGSVELKLQQIDHNLHYWRCRSDDFLSADLHEAQSIADSAHHWYRGHSLSVHARSFYQLIPPAETFNE